MNKFAPNGVPGAVVRAPSSSRPVAARDALPNISGPDFRSYGGD